MARTLAEIGRLAGCSNATVSRALNSSGSVSPETRAAVLRAVKETKYVRRTTVPSLDRNPGKTRESRMVELVLHRHTPTEPLSFGASGLAVGPLLHFPDSGHLLSKPYRFSSSFYRRIIDGAAEELARWDCRVVLQLNEDLDSTTLMRDVNFPDRAGVLLMGEYSSELDNFIESCKRPLVLVDLIHPGTVAISTDNLMGIGHSFEHLLALGHHKIGFVGRSIDVPAFAERFAAFQLKMCNAGLQINPQWVYEGVNHIEITADGVRNILGQSDRPTAFICSNDCYALGVVRAASTLNLRIPHDLSVVGFDDEESASLVTPPLTTVRVPAMEMGRQAVRQLMTQIRYPDSQTSSGYQIRLAPTLVVRESTAAAPTA